MGEAARTAVREPGVETAEQYARRVHLLAVIFVVLFATAIVGIALLVWKAQFFVTLAQRSNVETLVLAFFLVFFAYVTTLSAPSLPGAARIAYYALLARASGNRVEVERKKMRTLGPPQGDPPVAMLNLVLEREDQPGQPFDVVVADDAGPAGRVHVDGVRLTHLEAHGCGSNDLLLFFVHQVNHLVGQRGVQQKLDVVNWKTIDDEPGEQYSSLVQFARNLERQLGAQELWPKVRLTDAECRELERRLATVCPAVRDEAFLPDWEYYADHKVPVIPEPLGLVSLGRSEPRADPVASMGCAVLVVLAVVAVLVIFIFFPPWVPGK
jgi:hypothetical protein